MKGLVHETFGALGAGDSKEEPVKVQEDPKVATETDLRSLIELGCVKDSIKIGKMEFVLKTVNVTDRLAVAEALPESPSDQQMFEFNKKLLALSIETVNGRPFENFYPGEFSDPVLAKMEIIGAFQSSVVSTLLKFYREISDRSDAQFSAEQVKK